MTAEPRIDPDRINRRRRREDTNVFSRLPAVYAASRRQGQQFLKFGGGLSIVEWRTLWDLHEAGPMTIRDLAAIQRTDHSLLSRALPAMRERGLVTVERGQGDARRMIVDLTDRGRAAYARAAPIMARRRRALRDVLSEEEITLFAGLLDRLETFLHIPAQDILSTEEAK
ncbi:MarR family winged helix-turn-helix transcriptional regulator [Thalassococcus sp. BH17M4-6]|uniref:MarR family winged helix-turn-helix transcriptional regulator n=1 Tax=Thalassococcus sp. BH17M4-6 TaxID=3413148 RepID=UPI003BBC8D17